MVSKIIQQEKKQAENDKRISFTFFSLNDVKSFKAQVENFQNLEPENKVGIVLTFCHKPDNNTKNYFMTIIFPSTISQHPETSIHQALEKIVNKKLRLYQGIFKYDYFDFEDQCFPNKVFKVKLN